MLELRNLSRVYKQRNGPQVNALDDVSLTFNEKGMIFVLGKSGSGKSTLLNVIGGLDKYTSGELFIKGKSTKSFKQNEFDSYRNTMVGFIFQEYNVLDDFTVGQNIGIALELQGKKATSETINEYLTLLDMTGYANRKPNTLSGGQKQRVAIARALVKNPEIIMADEPTGALDSATGEQLFKALKQLSLEKLVIVVTHDHDFANRYGDRIIEFSDGKIIRDVTKVEKSDDKPHKTITEEGITISAGYVLTDEDVIQINNYLVARKENTSINVINDAYHFIDTEVVSAPMHTDELPLIKSRLPFTKAIKMGASALKHKTVRLVFSILLASTAFTMFGLTDTMASFNQKTTAIETMINKGVEYSIIKKTEQVKVTVEMLGSYTSVIEMRASDSDITDLEDRTSSRYFPIINEYDFQLGSDFFYYISDYNNLTKNPFYTRSSSENWSSFYSFRSLTHFASAADLPAANLTLKAGSLPTGHNHIAIPEFLFDAFKEFGYRAPTDTTSESINNYADMIDKVLFDNYIVKGIIDTKIDLTPFAALADEDADLGFFSMLGPQYEQYLQTSFHTAIFMSELFFDEAIAAGASYRQQFDSYDVMFEAENETYIDYVPTSSLSGNANTIFFNNGKTLLNLAEKEILLDLSGAIRYMPELLPLFDSAKAAVDTLISSSDAYDAEIEQFLLSNYSYFDVQFFEVTPYTSWNEATKLRFRGYYATALKGSLLYSINPYNPGLTGESIIRPAFNNLLITENLAPKDVSFIRYERNGTTQPIDLAVVGIHFDFLYVENYINLPTVYLGEDTALTLNLTLDGIYSYLIAYHGLNRDKINEILTIAAEANSGENGFFFSVDNHVLFVVNTIGVLIMILSTVFTTLGIIFAIFAALLLINFITLSVTFKRQEIGILRAIGARGIDVASIFLNEASIIAAINFAISLTATFIFSGVLNTYLRTQVGIDIIVLVVGFRQIGLIFLIAFGIAALSSFIPVFRLTLKKPIDAIKNR